jgi:hypothetical protein
MSDEMSHKPEVLFAIEEDSPLNWSLADYRRLNEEQRTARAAELRRKVEIEISASRRPFQRRQRGLIDLAIEFLLGRSLVQAD